MNKKPIVCLSLLVALTGAIIASTSSVTSKIGYANNEECIHNGYHYNYLKEKDDTPGHEEFWSCCKCQKAFLEKPEVGTFIDATDDNMTGGLDEDHIAYIPENPYLAYCFENTITTENGISITQLKDIEGTTYTRIGKDNSFLYFEYFDPIESKTRSAYVGINNPKDSNGSHVFGNDVMFYVRILKANTPEWRLYFNTLDEEITKYMDLSKHDLAIMGVTKFDGVKVHTFNELKPTIYCELGSLFNGETFVAATTLFDIQTTTSPMVGAPKDGTYACISVDTLELAFTL